MSALAAALAICGGHAAAAQDGEAPPCGGDVVARGAVRHVVDGRTFTLEDGRDVRLAAVEVPPLAAGGDAAAEPGGAAARAALDALAGGDDVVLRGADIATDRYGRLVAYVYTLRDGAELFVQGEMVAAGLARVDGSNASSGCAADLLARERSARRSKLGLWADSYYDILDADNPVDVLAQRGRFALVEGKVVSVRESGATIYVNFGRRWSEDFSVTIAKRNERSFTAAGLDPKGLEGRRIRVRGWIEARGGFAADGTTQVHPWIEAARPEQIEVDDHE